MGGGHAHYVVVDEHGHRVWSRDRGACTLYEDVLLGPDAMLAFVREQRGGTPDFWMNSVWWQGVLLLDLPRRRMLVHTFQEVWDGRAMSVPEIRTWLGRAREAWPGWEVTWATRSLHEVMEYLGLPYDTVRYLDDPPLPLREQWAGGAVEDGDPADSLISVRDASGRTSYCGWWVSALSDVLLAGPGVLLVPQDDAAPSAALDAVPCNGLHVDVPSRRLDWWATDLPLDPHRLDEVWRGWTLTDHGMTYEDVTPLMGPSLTITSDT